jgi:hypothetical protein
MFPLKVSVLRLADTQKPAAAAFSQAVYQSSHPPTQSHQTSMSSFRESFINKEVEQQFWGRDVTL